MKTLSRSITAAGLLAMVAAAASCGTAAGGRTPPTVSPANEAPSPPAAAQTAGGASQRRHSEADARFMRGMIAHHAQALEMTALVRARSGRQDVRLFAERMEVSQRDETALMRRWLRTRGAEESEADAHHAHGGHAMPGMLTAEEMARLAAATGAEFDRLFLELMIRHHEGALAMVAQLLATQGAGQDAELFQFASDVDADQRAEIARMRGMLQAPPSGTGVLQR